MYLSFEPRRKKLEYSTQLSRKVCISCKHKKSCQSPCIGTKTQRHKIKKSQYDDYLLKNERKTVKNVKHIKK